MLPETCAEVGIDCGVGLHLDLERVERLAGVDGGRRAHRTRHEVDEHVLVAVGAAVIMALLYPVWLHSPGNVIAPSVTESEKPVSCRN